MPARIRREKIENVGKGGGGVVDDDRLRVDPPLGKVRSAPCTVCQKMNKSCSVEDAASVNIWGAGGDSE